MEAQSAGYPATLTIDHPERIANWRPLVHWLLAIPHFIVLAILGALSELLAFVSWLVIVFTGKLPEGLAALQCLYVRYSTRVSAYAGFLVEEYPPFTFDTTGADPGDYQRVQIGIAPVYEDRNRVTVFFRLILAIPHMIAFAVLGIAAFICLFIGGIAVLFTGRWPEGLRDFIVKVARWNVRFQAYLALLTDDYPPFTLD